MVCLDDSFDARAAAVVDGVGAAAFKGVDGQDNAYNANPADRQSLVKKESFRYKIIILDVKRKASGGGGRGVPVNSGYWRSA